MSILPDWIQEALFRSTGLIENKFPTNDGEAEAFLRKDHTDAAAGLLVAKFYIERLGGASISNAMATALLHFIKVAEDVSSRSKQG